MSDFIDLILHVDRSLLELVDNYGAWVYALLFVIVYAETGLVVTPFLPGDSLLFAAGALAATGVLDGWGVFGLVVVAAVLGNTVNYTIGRAVGQRLIDRAAADPRLGRWLKVDFV
jgi:membrane-associated protein